MNKALRTAMIRQFSGDFDIIDRAMKMYLMSQPLAVKVDDRIWISHSLPADRFMGSFDVGVFTRKLTAELNGQLEEREDDAIISMQKARMLFTLIEPAGGMLVGIPEAAGRVGEIDGHLGELGLTRAGADGL